VIKYKQGKENIVVDELLHMYVFLSTLDARFLGFEYIKELYKDDSDFANVYNACETSASRKFYRWLVLKSAFLSRFYIIILHLKYQ